MNIFGNPKFFNLQTCILHGLTNVVFEVCWSNKWHRHIAYFCFIRMIVYYLYTSIHSIQDHVFLWSRFLLGFIPVSMLIACLFSKMIVMKLHFGLNHNVFILFIWDFIHFAEVFDTVQLLPFLDNVFTMSLVYAGLQHLLLYFYFWEHC